MSEEPTYDPGKIYDEARAKAQALPPHPFKDMPRFYAEGRAQLATPEATNWDAYKRTADYRPNSGPVLNFAHNLVRSMYARPSDRFRRATADSQSVPAPWSTLSRLYAGFGDTGIGANLPGTQIPSARLAEVSNLLRMLG